jgi:uncharacterized lipoprotein YddW (UPF0748 family)
MSDGSHDATLVAPRRVGRGRFAFRVAAVALLAIAGVIGWASTADLGSTGGAQGQEAARGAEVNCGRRLVATRELRGMTITTVHNLDWPSRPGLPTEQVKAEYLGWLDLAVSMNHNAVFVHVRPSGDAFWQSPYAPWSHWLTGRKDGSDPGWDPMRFLVDEAHARNLEFHAWLNPYKASQFGTMAELAPSHPLRAHPEWAIGYPSSGQGRRIYYNPGIPAARTFVEDSILDVVKRYDIDAVFFDDFFYPYPADGEEFPDAASYATYGKEFRSRAEWRRTNVNLFIKETGERIKALKPWVKFGISPFGIWRNKSSDPAGSASGGLESYSAISADSRRWVQEEWIDYVVPQLYWHIGNEIADYAVLVRWWSKLVQGTRVQLYIAQGDYRIGEAGAWRNPALLDRQLALNDTLGVKGSIHFSARHVRADWQGAVTRYRKAHYGTPALVPEMGHLPDRSPNAPTVLWVRPEGATTMVTWTPPRDGPAPSSYAVYRAGGSDDPAQLVATVRANGAPEQSWTDRAAAPGQTYCVTALSRLWKESGAM